MCSTVTAAGESVVRTLQLRRLISCKFDFSEFGYDDCSACTYCLHFHHHQRTRGGAFRLLLLLLLFASFKAKRKKPSQPERPSKKPKGGETSKPGGSSKGSSNGDDNMFQVWGGVTTHRSPGFNNTLNLSFIKTATFKYASRCLIQIFWLPADRKDAIRQRQRL